jgi:N-acetylmuramoyl-L-alanine amidase
MNATPTPPKKRTGAHVMGPTILVAMLLATLFTAVRPGNITIGDLTGQIRSMLTPQPMGGQADASTPRSPLHIGIVAGHLGNDPGAVCKDANDNLTLTEQEVNFKIATLVQKSLTERGFEVDLLQEYDTRLGGYRGVALVSIHNDSCDYINDQATGFKVAAAMDTRDVNRATRLTACLIDRYARVTGLAYHAESITRDMTEYHSFSEIDPTTIAAIIETGFLNLDQDFLTGHTDLVAEGIVQGILCFVNNENVEPTPIP